MYEILDNWITPWLGQSIGLYLFCLSLSILLGFYILIKGGDWLSTHSSNVAFQLGVPPVVVGLTIVSIATSTPELFTSISALRSDSPGLILGNIIGSNIANIGLILGIALLIGTVPTAGAVSVAQRTCLALVTLGFCVLLYLSPTSQIGLSGGIFFLGFILVYLTIVTLHALSKKQPSKSLANLDEIEPISYGIIFSVFMLLFSTIALWVGADALVYGSKNLAQLAGVPEELIGFTLLAIGTSLPELAASVSLVRKRQTSMLLGNIVGSNLFNIGLIGGLAGIMGPVRSGAPYPWVDYLFLLITTFLLIYWLSGRTLKKAEGIILLLVYLAASIFTWIANS